MFEDTILTVGTTTLTNAGLSDMFMVKYDGSGNVLWANSAGGIDTEDMPFSVANDASGSVYVSGSFYSSTITFGATTLSNVGNYDIFLTKIASCTSFANVNETACNSFTSPSGNHVWTSSGTYFDTLPNAAGCDSIITFNLTINPLPVAQYTMYADTVTPHNWYALNQCSGTPPLSYVWNWGDSTATSTGATPSHVYSTAGYYNICVDVTDGNGCTKTYCDSSTNLNKGSSNALVTLNVVTALPTGIENVDAAALTLLYPNPAINELTISNAQWATAKAVTIIITDVTGKELYKNTTTGQQKTTINTTDFKSGIYFVQIQTPDFIETKKLNIQK
jgi:PKD repeat protein